MNSKQIGLVPDKKNKKKPRKSASTLQDPQVSSTSETCRHDTEKNIETEFEFLNELLPVNSKLGQPRIRPTGKWFESQYNDVAGDNSSISQSLLLKFETYAAILIEREVECYETKKSVSKSSESSWLKNISVGGTVGDRIAALIVQIHENPVLSLDKIKNLISKVDKTNRREALLTAEAFRDMCSQNLLPDRKLVSFKNRPLLKIKELSSGNKLTIDKRLIFWYFEDKLKLAYEDFIRQLEKITHDTVDVNRIKAAGILADLLINKPEQEKFLLSSLINKLGDPSSKVASKVVSFLSRLVEAHSNMNSTVVDEVKNLIYRLHISPRAQYYGVVFLSQIRLHKVIDSDLASQLINIYFGLFKILVEKGSVDNKTLALLLRGTNKAFPVAKDNKNLSLLKDIDTLYKVAAIGNLNTSLQAMLLLLQVLETSEGVNDRFYCSLYRKLSDPSVDCGSHNLPLLFHLLYKTLKGDVFEGRVAAFVKRLLQIALFSTAPFACAVLSLVSELLRDKPALLKLSKNAQNTDFLDCHVKNESDDDEEEHFTDVHGPESESESEIPRRKSRATKKASWVHKVHSQSNSRNKFGYDPYHRNPMFANASSTLLYELDLLRNHYHPSVALFAQQITNQEPIEYSGDPLQDFTLMRFLERFAYRNPKRKADAGDGSSASKKLPKKTSYSPWGVRNVAVTSDDYARVPTDQIPADEQYLHRYIKSFGVSQTGGEGGENDDAGSVNSEEFDQALADNRLKVPNKF